MIADPVAARSPRLTRLFTYYTRWYFSRNFHALRLSRAGRPVFPPDCPLIICANHPGWWDPLLYVLLMDTLFPRLAGFGPMDEAALGRYGLFRKLGIFGVERGTMRGSANFLHACTHILQNNRHILWVTGEGEFTDPRSRPIRLRPGIGHLARRADKAVILPMAVEYCFWNERFPEALVRFGDPVPTHGDATAITERTQAALQQTMDALAGDAMRRDTTLFDQMLGGRRGMGGLYSWFQRAQAFRDGVDYHPDHASAPETINTEQDPA